MLQSQGHFGNVFSSRELKIYMVRQHEQWCTYVREVLKHEVKPEDIVLINGWVKTSADWAAAAFSNLVSKHYMSIQSQASRFIGLELFRSRARAQSGPKMHRQGSKYPRGKGRTLAELDKDQSVFLQRYKLKRRLGILKTIIAAAGYDRLPDHGGGGDAGDGLLAEDGQLDVDGEDVDEDGLNWLQGMVSSVLRLLTGLLY